MTNRPERSPSRRSVCAVAPVLALLLAGCGDAGPLGEATPALDSPSGSAPDSDGEDACKPGRSCVGASPGTHRCIVYLQPHPSSDTVDNTNPLYTAVKRFFSEHKRGNEAAGYPPHVSMIGFFACPDPSVIRQAINEELKAINRPLGRPIVEDIAVKRSDSGDINLRLELSEGDTTRKYYERVVAAVEQVSKAARNDATHFAVPKYHLSLFSGDDLDEPVLVEAAIDDFEPFSQWNAKRFPENAWDIVLYQTHDGTLPLVQVKRWRVNPVLEPADLR